MWCIEDKYCYVNTAYKLSHKRYLFSNDQMTKSQKIFHILIWREKKSDWECEALT